MSELEGTDVAEIAVFDFDDTLVRGDSGRAFLGSIIAGHPLRAIFALALSPLAVPLLFHRRTLRWGLSCFLWVGTLGCSERDLEALYERFGRNRVGSAAGNRVLRDAWQALRKHRGEGRRIAILSGSPTGLVSAIARRIDAGPVTIVGSTTRRFAGGFVLSEHCVREQKLAMALRAGLAKGPWHSGYSDSSWDIPMLRGCRARYAVNPSPRGQRHLARAFGSDVAIVRWQ